MNIIEEKWDSVVDTLSTEFGFSPISINTWIKPLQVQRYDSDEGTLFIYVPIDEMGINEDFINSYINKKFTTPLRSTIAELTGLDCTKIVYTVEQNVVKEADSSSNTDNSFNNILEKANLNPEYTFENFVVGSNNKFAHAASLAVAESPGEIYNPLFLYGGVGLGKTHLMHSIAHFILENNPQTRVLYVTSESFTNELIEAIRNGNNTAMTKFREKYRNIDVLLIDDIQFIIGKESTQEEFFHTFNDLHGAKKQIIISSDKPPKEIETLEERLRSRFEWGLTVDIQSPDYETRMAILRKKEEMEGYNIDNEVIKYIATNIKSNIRELEGALTKIVALSKLDHNKEINIALAEEALKDIISPNAERKVTPELIIQVVADHFGITPLDISSQKRNKEVVYPRQIVMYLCQSMTGASLQEIGRYLGGRDHTTIIHGREKIAADLKTNENLANTIEILKKKLSPQ